MPESDTTYTAETGTRPDDAPQGEQILPAIQGDGTETPPIMPAGDAPAVADAAEIEPTEPVAQTDAAESPKPGAPAYVLLRTVEHDGERYAAGECICLDDERAAALIDAGIVKRHEPG